MLNITITKVVYVCVYWLRACVCMCVCVRARVSVHFVWISMENVKYFETNIQIPANIHLIYYCR